MSHLQLLEQKLREYEFTLQEREKQLKTMVAEHEKLLHDVEHFEKPVPPNLDNLSELSVLEYKEYSAKMDLYRDATQKMYQNMSLLYHNIAETKLICSTLYGAVQAYKEVVELLKEYIPTTT